VNKRDHGDIAPVNHLISIRGFTVSFALPTSDRLHDHVHLVESVFGPIGVIVSGADYSLRVLTFASRLSVCLLYGGKSARS